MKILPLLTEDHAKYIQNAVDDISYDANATGYEAGLTSPICNNSDEAGTTREQKRKRGIARALRLMKAKKKIEPESK